ncbi:P-loop NTPase family protein [Gluconobacter kondonii]|uniref:hypothetical protein n=1 Tax=Gluconobacter kondonii TaxID=941463 RepID=UPI00197F769F|nr:hypothetical protein [Gluconobacter kondonii]MBN3868008.1 hypothetical protein [Gluconobacter kondonii]
MGTNPDIVSEHDLLNEDEEHIGTRPPVFLFPTGRGNRGKTFFTRWVVEDARNMGREVIVADGDCTNQTLSAYFPDASSPSSADQVTVTKWFEELIEAQIKSRKSLIVDFGAGDRTLKHAAHDLSLDTFLSHHGIRPVVIHFVGPDPDDLASLHSFETGNLFAPAATIIVYNQFAIPPHVPPSAAFANSVAKSTVIQQILDRDGEIVVMPILGCAHEIERRRLGFIEAAEGQTKGDLPSLGLIDRQRVRLWQAEMKSRFSNVASWLP